ncbi:MAG: molybdenum cofactor guanylyltransferase [Thermodesulfobacteriota bacterium]|nr:molybdenum cofactor guanylyltransferase [Thermodesulfobacteriota bacterium]
MEKGLTGLILAGGGSTRLGQDKARLPVFGKSLLERTVHLAGKYCVRVYVSGRDPSKDGIDAPWLPDDRPGIGPMGGILTGLNHLGGPLLVLACDLPLIQAETIQRLIQVRKNRPDSAVMTVYHQEETGYIEALVAIYEDRAAVFLEEARQKGVYKLSQAIPESARHLVAYAREQASEFLNINSPADLDLLSQVMGMPGRGPFLVKTGDNDAY